MSRSIRETPPAGKEYWKSRLHPGGENRGPLTKLWTHRKERAEGKRQAKSLALEADDVIDFEQFAETCDEEAPALRAQRVTLNLRRDRLRGLDPEEWGDAWRSIDEAFERLAEKVKDWTARAKCVKLAEKGKVQAAAELWRWRERERADFLLLERWMR